MLLEFRLRIYLMRQLYLKWISCICMNFMQIKTVEVYEDLYNDWNNKGTGSNKIISTLYHSHSNY